MLNFANRYLLLTILAIAILNCSSSQEKKPEEKPVVQQIPGVSDEQRLKQIQYALRSTYGKYKYLKVDFTVKGNVDNQDVEYSGYLKSYSADPENPNIAITIIEPTLQSPLFALIVKKQTVTRKNFVEGSSRRTPLSRFKWVEVFGRVFPFQFFLPILMGSLPADVYSGEAKYVQAKNRILYKSDHYDVAVNLKSNDKVDTMYYNSKLSKEILIIQFIGSLKNNLGRTFPQRLVISQNRDEDYLKMNFRRLYMK